MKIFPGVGQMALPLCLHKGGFFCHLNKQKQPKNPDAKAVTARPVSHRIDFWKTKSPIG